MAIALTIIICFLSAGLLAGRIYEILKLTDLGTGFYFYKGIVFNPLILGIFAVIVVCCGIIILGDNKKPESFFAESSKIISLAAGAMFAVYGVMAVQSGITAVFVIAGALAFIVAGFCGLRPVANLFNIAFVVLTVIFIAGLCLDIIVFNVNTIHNIGFIKNALSYISLGIFLVFMMKNVYSPSASSPMLLYITGMLAFALCGMMNVADIIVMVMNGNSVLPDLFINAGFAFAGFLALDNAVSVISHAAEPKEKVLGTTEEQTIITTEENVAPEQNSAAKAEAQMKKDDFRISETAERKIVFSSKGEQAVAVRRKANEKVVYKRPKN